MVDYDDDDYYYNVMKGASLLEFSFLGKK